jgi:hypothetical protein
LNGGAYAKNHTPRQKGAAWGADRDNPDTSYKRGAGDFQQPEGRWPAHLVLDEGAASLLDEQSGIVSGTPKSYAPQTRRTEKAENGGLFNLGKQRGGQVGDVGGPSRFFYVPKAPSSEKYAAFYCECTDYKVKDVVVASSKDEQKISCPHCGKEMQKTAHPTIKSVALMEWLVKMVAPKGSVVLDPFTGSGTTGVAAVNLGCRFIGIEKEKPYCAVARHRVKNKAS